MWRNKGKENKERKINITYLMDMVNYFLGIQIPKHIFIKLYIIIQTYQEHYVFLLFIYIEIQFILFYQIQEYNVVIQTYYRLYFLYTYYKILDTLPILHNIPLQLIYFKSSNFYLISYLLSSSPFLSSPVTTSSFFISVNIYTLLYSVVHFTFQIP